MPGRISGDDAGWRAICRSAFCTSAKKSVIVYFTQGFC
jgi:hypothetical protein